MQALGGGRLETIRSVILPGALPYILTGIRSGLGFGWRALIAAELVGTPDGLGQMIFAAADYHRSDIIIAGCLIIGAIAIAMDRWLLLPIERRTIERWGLVIDATKGGRERARLAPPERRRTARWLLGPDGRKLVAGVLLIALVLCGQELYGWATAGQRLDPSLRGATGPSNVVVVLDFSRTASTASGSATTAPSPAATARSTACACATSVPENLRASRQHPLGRAHRADEVRQAMSDGEVHYVRAGAVATVIFDRPAARNAMTWRMYEQLGEACARIRGRTDCASRSFAAPAARPSSPAPTSRSSRPSTAARTASPTRRRWRAIVAGVETLPVPTLAVIEGYAIGGGLAIATACDLRIATPDSRFGIPIARTLGNCLSVANYARLVAALGASRAKRMLLLAENLAAEEALAGGFLSEIVAAPDLDRRVAELADRLAQHAPITMRVSKEAIRRIAQAAVAEGDDLVRACYGSDDFRRGVDAFVEKRESEWTGR